MNRIAYFDCFSGISGDMFLGACLDLGVEEKSLKAELAKLGLKGFSLKVDKVKKSGISATKATVQAEEEKKHRHLKDIVSIIEGSQLSSNVKNTSIDIFSRLAEAEAHVHGTVPEKIHFHEVGALDAIVDIVGASICLEILGLEKVFCSSINVGSGLVKCQHGNMPVPAPATLELLRGLPVHAKGDCELATPTGVAIISTAADCYGFMPDMIVDKVGYGAGEKNLEIPNLLRIILGCAVEERSWESGSGQAGKNS